jgi:hypothetical protein
MRRALATVLILTAMPTATLASADDGRQDSGPGHELSRPELDFASAAMPPSGLVLDFSAASLSTAAFVYPNQDSQPPETDPLAEPTSDWRFIAQLQWWLPLRIKGSIEVGPTSTDMDIDLKTLIEDLKFIIEGGFEVTNDQWSFLVWGLYMNIGTDVTTDVPFLGTFDTSLGFKMTHVNMAVAYRVGDWPLEKGKTATMGLDLLAGLIVWDTDLEISERFPGGFDPMIKEENSWVDLIIGGRILFDISDKFNASVRGEVGGFGIGSSSSLTWNVTVLAEYKFHPNWGLVAGYRYLDLDWEQGSGLDRIGYDWTIHGPIIGVNIHF